MNPADFTDVTLNIPITIAASASLSGAVNLKGFVIVGIIVPTGWTAANITLKASRDGGNTYYPVFDDSGNEVVITVTSTGGYYITLANFQKVSGLNYIKVQSGTNASNVTQTSQMVLTLVCRLVG